MSVRTPPVGQTVLFPEPLPSRSRLWLRVALWAVLLVAIAVAAAWFMFATDVAPAHGESPDPVPSAATQSDLSAGSVPLPVGPADTAASEAATIPLPARGQPARVVREPAGTPGRRAPAGPEPDARRPAERANIPSNTPGLLAVSSRPWGDVVIDGTPRGPTPQLAIVLTPGRHRVEIRRAGYRPYVTTITVAAGETVRLTRITLEEIS